MKIVIKSEGKNLFIVLPTAICLNRLSAAVAAHALKNKQDVVDISAEDLAKVFDAVKKYRRKYGTWELVNVRTAKGEIVLITI